MTRSPSDPTPTPQPPPPAWKCRECGVEFDPYWHGDKRPHCSIECARAERLRGQDEYRALRPEPDPRTCGAVTTTTGYPVHPHCMNPPKYPDGRCWQHSEAPAAVTRRQRVNRRRKIHSAVPAERSPEPLTQFLRTRTSGQRVFLWHYADTIASALR